MSRLRLPLALASLLALGCAKPQVISVPPPVPPVIPRPALRVKALTPNSTQTEVLRAYVLDLADQVGYADALEILLYGPIPAGRNQ